MSAAIIPFPCARRLDLVRSIVRRALLLQPFAAEAHIRRSLELQAIVMRRKGIGEALVLRENTKQIQRTTLALMRGEHALKQLEAKTIDVEEAVEARLKPSPRSVEDRKRRAADIVGSFEGDFVTAFGEFAATVVRETNGVRDARLTRAPGGASEGSPTDGGFLVPDQFLPVKYTIYGASELASFADIRETAIVTSIRSSTGLC